MDNFTFIAEVTKALAWPITAIVALLLLRPILRNLVPLLQRLRYKDVELEFGQQVDKMRAEATAGLRPVEEDSEVSPRQERLIKLAEISPVAAVLDSWSHLEASLIDAAQERKVKGASRALNVDDAIMTLRDNDAIDFDTTSLVRGLRYLRNSAAHHTPEFTIGYSSAIEYGNLALALARSLSN